jgi:hypothetical protein
MICGRACALVPSSFSPGNGGFAVLMAIRPSQFVEVFGARPHANPHTNTVLITSLLGNTSLHSWCDAKLARWFEKKWSAEQLLQVCCEDRPKWPSAVHAAMDGAKPLTAAAILRKAWSIAWREDPFAHSLLHSIATFASASRNMPLAHLAALRARDDAQYLPVLQLLCAGTMSSNESVNWTSERHGTLAHLAADHIGVGGIVARLVPRMHHDVIEARHPDTGATAVSVASLTNYNSRLAAALTHRIAQARAAELPATAGATRSVKSDAVFSPRPRA